VGQYPNTLTSYVLKILVSGTIKSMKQNVWVCKIICNITSQTLIEKCCWCVDWIVVCWITSVKIYLSWKFNRSFRVKLASSVKSTRRLKERPSPHYRKDQADLELVPVAIFTGTVTLLKELEKLSCLPHVRQLISDGHCITCPRTSPSSAVSRSRATRLRPAPRSRLTTAVTPLPIRLMAWCLIE
jgi:hypothetical protein